MKREVAALLKKHGVFRQHVPGNCRCYNEKLEVFTQHSLGTRQSLLEILHFSPLRTLSHEVMHPDEGRMFTLRLKQIVITFGQ